MSGRGASATLLTEVEKARNQPVHLFEAWFDEGTLYETDAPRQLTFNGQTYRALGQLLQFEAIEESSDLQIHECRVSLSGINDEWVALVQQSEYIDRRLIVRKAFLTDAQVLISDAFLLFDGRMDAPTITMDPESGKYVVGITATSQLANLNRITGRRTNSTDQQSVFPLDTGFRYAHEGARNFIWGRAGSQNTAVQAQTAANYYLRR